MIRADLGIDHAPNVDASDTGFHALFASSELGVVEFELETENYRRVNGRFEEIVGIPAGGWRKMSFVDHAHPEDVARLRAAFERIRSRTTASVSKEIRVLGKRGRVVWVDLIVTELTEQSDRPRVAIALLRDISGRKQRELNAAFVVDVQSLLVETRNPEETLRRVETKIAEQFSAHTADFLRVDPDEPVGSFPKAIRDEGPRAVVNVTLLPGVLESFLTELSTQRTVAIEEVKRDPRSANVSALRESAECAALLLAAQVSAGKCRCVLAIQDDKRRAWQEYELALARQLVEMMAWWMDGVNAARALRDAQAKLTCVKKLETVGIVTFNHAGEIVTANDAFLDLSGYDRDELRLGLMSRDAGTPRNWMTALKQAAAELQEIPELPPRETEYSRKDGTSWWGMMSVVRLTSSQNLAVVVDVTRRKHAEEQLLKHREQLEDCVLERTARIDSLNGALRDEILERTRGAAERAFTMKQLVAAQEDERRRISRELHDVVGQHLTALALGLNSLSDSAGTRSAEVVKDLKRLTEAVGQEVHALALELRPTALDDIGLVRTLSNFVEDWSSRVKVEVDFHTQGFDGKRLPPHVETTLYRIVCEAFNNVLKHANAQRVSLILERRDDQALAIVEDDGKGFQIERVRGASDRLGLTGMRERAALVGGELKLESAPGQGTTVFVRIPLGEPT